MPRTFIDLSKADELSVDNDLAYAKLGYDSKIGIDVCNGFEIDLSASLFTGAGVSPQIGRFIKLVVEAEAKAEVGVTAAIQLSPKIMDEFGLVAAISAYAKASASAKLSIEVQMQAVLDHVKRKTDVLPNQGELPFRIFEEFIDQTQLGIGVGANAQIAATIVAETLCRGRLIKQGHQQPGFDFRVSAEAAFIYGAGTEFFLTARFTRINTFFSNSKRHVLNHFESKLVENQRDKKNQISHIFGLIDRAIDLIILVASVDSKADPKEMVALDLSDMLFNFIVRELVNLYDLLLQRAVNEVNDWISLHAHTFSDDIDTELLLTELQQAGSALENATDILTTYAALCDTITILRTLGFARSHQVLEIVATSYFLHFMLANSDDANQMQQAPALIADHYQAKVSHPLGSLASKHQAHLYLQNSQLLTLSTERLGEAGGFIDTVMTQLSKHGLCVFDLLYVITDDSLPLRAKQTDDQLVIILIDVLGALYKDYLAPKITTQIQQRLQDAGWLQQSDIAKEYFDQFVVRTVFDLPSVILPVIKASLFPIKASANAPDEDSIDLEYLRFVGNYYLMNFASRNICYANEFAMTLASQQAEQTLSTCIDYLKTQKFDAFVHQYFDRLETKIRQAVPLPHNRQFQFKDDVLQDLVVVTKAFLIEIFVTGRKALGTDTWTESRIDQIVDGIEAMLLNIDGGELMLDGLSPRDIAAKIDDVTACSFLPDPTNSELQALLRTLADIGLVQGKSFLIKMPIASAQYLKEVIRILFMAPLAEFFNEVWRTMLQTSEDVKDMINVTLEAIVRIANNIIAYKKQIDATVGDLVSDIDRMLDAFFDNLLMNIDKEKFLTLALSRIRFLNVQTARQVMDAIKQDVKDDLTINGRVITSLINEAKEGTLNHTKLNEALKRTLLKGDTKRLLQQTEYQTGFGYDDIFSPSGIWQQALIDHYDAAQDIVDTSTDITSANKAKATEEAKKLSYQAMITAFNLHKQQLHNLPPVSVKINSPIPIEVDAKELNQEQTPLYGKYMLIDIQVTGVDIQSIIDQQLLCAVSDITGSNMKSSDLSPSSPSHIIYQDGNDILYKTPLYLCVTLNGNVMPLSQFVIESNQLRAHVNKDWLKQGTNTLSVSLIAPDQFKRLQVNQHVSFIANLKSMTQPSNALHIDPLKTVFNAPGNDHSGARSSNLSIKEKVVITNDSSVDVDLNGYFIRDAFGHKFSFFQRTILPSQTSYEIFIGRSKSTRRTWNSIYSRYYIAMLNNKGEFLELVAPDASVVSQLYYGYPNSNPDLNFVTKESAQ